MRGRSGAKLTAPTEQRSLAQSIFCRGIGLHDGAPSRLILHPAPADHGIVFRRIDDHARGAEIRAEAASIAGTELGTTLANADGVRVATVEHLLAALAGLGIDNLLVEIEGTEIPAMDGSAEPFVFLLESAGIAELGKPRKRIVLPGPIEVRHGDRFARLEPAKAFALDVTIDFDHALIGRQNFSGRLEPAMFRRELAPARSFGFAADIDRMRASGLARGGSLANAVVLAGEKVMNPEGLRFADEFVRHKALDAVGDLHLAGGLLMARYRAERPGHALHAALLARLTAELAAEEAGEPEAQAPAIRPAPLQAAADD
ncbi:MAG: UDP-3-O-[3-hydroxymyristoyl] N-acetylglucosamine deacetylase [Alphaproteobacteria bacterium]|nr:UDP-3-O-[3-hydroxymyristoyl] N-acetylglucosamine deacetylase [Alphaproteobacteria bacterium]